MNHKISSEGSSRHEIISQSSNKEELKIWTHGLLVEDSLLEVYNRGLCRANHFNIAYGETKRKQLVELKQFLLRESREFMTLKRSKKRLLMQLLNSLNETHTYWTNGVVVKT